MNVPACKLSFCFAGFTEHGFISCDCAISGGVNIAGGLFKKADDLKCFFFLFPFSFPFELSPRDSPDQATCSFNLLAFSSNFPFLSRDMLDWQTKVRKDMRIKTQRADLSPRKEREMSRVQPGRGQGAVSSLLPSLLPELVFDL